MRTSCGERAGTAGPGRREAGRGGLGTGSVPARRGQRAGSLTCACGEVRSRRTRRHHRITVNGCRPLRTSPSSAAASPAPRSPTSWPRPGRWCCWRPRPALGTHSTARSAATWIPGHGVAAVRALITASGPRFAALAAELGAPPLLSPRPVLWTASDADGRGGARRAARRACGRAGRARPRRPRRGPPALPRAARGPRRRAHRGRRRRRRRRPARRLRARAPTAAAAPCARRRRVAVLRPRRRGLAGRARRRRRAPRRRDRRRGGRVGGRRRRARRRAAARAHAAAPDDRGGPGARPRAAAAARRRAAADGLRGHGPLVLQGRRARTCWSRPPTRPRAEPGDARPDELDVALALERVEEVTGLGLRSVVTSWAGLRSFVPDRRPGRRGTARAPGLLVRRRAGRVGHRDRAGALRAGRRRHDRDAPCRRTSRSTPPRSLLTRLTSDGTRPDLRDERAARARARPVQRRAQRRRVRVDGQRARLLQLAGRRVAPARPQAVEPVRRGNPRRRAAGRRP